MSEYIAVQTRQVIITADSAAEARKIAESIFYVRPGFNRELRKQMRETGLTIEKRRN
jgi:hypothetical protein